MKISRGHHCQIENCDGPDYEHDIRLARRLKRRSIANQPNHKYCANDIRTSLKNCCNSTEKETTENDAVTEEDEVDYDYKYFLDNFSDYILDICDDSVGGSNFGDDKTCESDNDDIDPQYKMFLDNLREDGNSYVLEIFADNQLLYVKYEEKQEENLSGELKSDIPNERPGSDVSPVAKQKHSSEVQCDSADEEYLEFLNSLSTEGAGVKRVYMESDSRSKKMGNPMESRKGLETKRGVSGKEGNSSIVGQKVQAFNEEIGALNKRPSPSVPCSAKNNCSNELQCNIVDKSYAEFLSSSRFYGEGFVYLPNGGNTKEYDHEGGSSSESELVIVEPDQFDEDTPFVSSSVYDLSCCENNENLGVGHSGAMYAIYSSQFRKGLMQELKRPYDQKEYEASWEEASRQRKKERHMEGREGRTKSIPLNALDKSYLEVHHDLAQAIDQVKDPHKVLFLLRGFFFWLKYKPHEGVFRPWLDKPCLEILQKL